MEMLSRLPEELKRILNAFILKMNESHWLTRYFIQKNNNSNNKKSLLDKIYLFCLFSSWIVHFLV